MCNIELSNTVNPRWQFEHQFVHLSAETSRPHLKNCVFEDISRKLILLQKKNCRVWHQPDVISGRFIDTSAESHSSGCVKLMQEGGGCTELYSDTCLRFRAIEDSTRWSERAFWTTSRAWAQGDINEFHYQMKSRWHQSTYIRYFVGNACPACLPLKQSCVQYPGT